MKTLEKFSPMLACDFHESKIKFPCLIQPKIDGVHALNQNGKLVGRSLKAFANKHVTALFSKPEYHGFQGEMIVGTNPSHPDLCRNTTSALNTIEGEPEVNWWLFDYITEETKDLPYVERIEELHKELERLDLPEDIYVVPSLLIYNLDQLNETDSDYLSNGFEGSILRNPNLPYKFGRCGKTFMGCWRVKRFIEEEIIVTEIKEGQHNNNEAKTNELGLTERSTSKENMLPNAQVGTIVGKLLKDVLEPSSGILLFSKGTEIDVSAGAMTQEERKYYFENQDQLIGKVVKFKMFPRGIKDKPRFPTFVSIRPDFDLVDV
jgi:DNA ligase-1